MAQRAIPLVADNEHVEVIYEDADMIAVNKPAGVISAPKHRFTVRPVCCATHNMWHHTQTVTLQTNMSHYTQHGVSHTIE